MKSFYKVKDSWDFPNYYNGDLVAAGGFLWPPRCYKCSFCKREFRSAQALGGHMNVHRRDRARLRQSPPRDFSTSNSCNNHSLLDLNLCPNPSFNQNPSFNLPLSSSHLSDHDQFPHFSSKLPQMLPSSGPVRVPSRISSAAEVGTGTDLEKMKDGEGVCGVGKCDGFVMEKGCGKINKKREFVRLDLEIGVFSECEEELDLELRL